MKLKSLLLTVFFTFYLPNVIFPQTIKKFDFYARGDYRLEVPRPKKILRFDVGEQHTTYAQMEMVINAIQKAAPDRVKIFDIGLTNENRMQHIVAISSPQNIAKLDQIKTSNAKLTDPRITSPNEANSIAQKNPTIAWMAYTIHGNESASFEAMMQVIYQLAASNEQKTLDILDKTVVLIITGENPDGHERFVTWYNSVAIGDPNPAAFEHREPWSIQGRFNHYRFDLNRDNIPISQKETQNMQKAFFEWNPQVVVDHHGQPSQFFFPPSALPINPNLPQPSTNKWLDIFGRGNAEAFDKNRWTYYVRDIFDLFYPGYWDSMSSLNGAIGMTYETDGGGFKGLNWRRKDGTIATLRSAIAKHYVASMATLETAAENREALLKSFYSFRQNGMEKARQGKLKRIVINPEKDRVKAAEMVEILKRTKIEIKVAQSSFRSQKAYSYMQKNARAESKSFPAGSYVIDLNQPQAIWIKALLEQNTPQDKSFIADNLARFRRNQRRGSSSNKESYGFYDITAWSLPLAFGIDAYWTEDETNVTGLLVTDGYLMKTKRGIVNTKGNIAYIFPYETDSAPAMALRLLKEGFRVGMSTRNLNAAGRNWKPGTFVIRVTRNPNTIHEAVSRLSGELGVNVTGVNTSYTEEGDTGVGGSNIKTLSEPKIAVVSGRPVRQTSYGAIWWTLDKYGIKFTPFSLANIKSGALKNYNALIMPDGSAKLYSSALGKEGINSLKQWISGGGTLITIRGASVFATLKNVALTSSLIIKANDVKKEKAKSEKKSAKDSAPNDQAQKLDKVDKTHALPPVVSPSANMNKVPERVPGAIMRSTVDRTTYLNYGVDSNELPVLVDSDSFFRYSKKGVNALIFDKTSKKPLTISGFAWEGNTEKLLKGTAYLIEERIGRGHAIIFADDILFRGIFRVNTRQFFNAILFNNEP